jgi:exodeoxyribonuclease VII large subunit
LLLFAPFCYVSAMACLSVSQLNEVARISLQSSFASEIWVRGEIQGFKLHAKSGHLYFDLVEKGPTVLEGYVAKISCAFFRGPYTKWRATLASLGVARFELNSGIEVKLKARIDLFVKEGRYQLIVSEIDPSFTLGAIAKKREQTIQSLRALGLFDRNKGLEFPELPLNIGLITSEGSAAFSDFMRIIRDSPYCFAITLFDAHMQGENTVPEVIRGIKALERHPDVDSIVIIRGGGAKTDLFSFDDISLCRAVALCPKPVVTGIGHEIDVSVADLVAHTYRVTPTDVARHYVGLADEVWAFLDEAGRDLKYRSGELLVRDAERLKMASAGLGHITRRWMAFSLSVLQGTAFRVHTTIAGALAKREQALGQSAVSLKSHAEAALRRQVMALAGMPPRMARDLGLAIRSQAERVEGITQAMGGNAQAMLERQNERLGFLDAMVGLLDPAETLKRGFSITIDSTGKVIRDANEVSEGDHIVTKLSKGKIGSIVRTKEPA